MPQVTGKRSVNLKGSSWLPSLARRGFQALGRLSTHPPKTADANNHHDTLHPTQPHSAPHPAPGADKGPSRHVRAQAGGEGEGKGREPHWPGHPAFNPAHPAGSSVVPQDRRELGYLYTNPGQVCT